MATKNTRSLSDSIGSGFGMLSNSLGKAYKALTPDVWNGDYNADQWQDWYSKSATPGADSEIPAYHEFATPETFAADRQYPSWDSHRLHQEWMQRAVPRFAPLFREFAAALSPEQRQALTLQPIDESLDTASINEIAARNGAIMQMLRDVRDGVLGKPHNSDNAAANQLREQFFDWLEGTSLLGAQRQDNSVTPEQYQQWASDPNPVLAANAQYRLSQTGQQQLDRLADYNLLRAFQTSPNHRPSQLKSAPLSVVSNAVAMGSEPIWGDTSGVSGANLQSLFKGTPKSALAATLVQDDYTRDWRKTNPELAKGIWSGAAVPQLSAGSPEGMDFTFTSPNTTLGRAQQYLTNFFLLQGLTTEPQRQQIIDVQKNLDRITPVIPGGKTFGDSMALSRRLENIEQGGWRGLSDSLPGHIYALNDLLGAPKDKPYIKPFYPSAFVNDLAMTVPAILGDPQNVAMTALSGGLGLLTSGNRVGTLARLLGQNIKEIPAEAGYNTGITVSQQPQSVGDYLFAPDPGVTLRTPDNRIPDPANRQEYEQAMQSKKSDIQKTLMDAGDWLNTKPQQPQQKSQYRGNRVPWLRPPVAM